MPAALRPDTLPFPTEHKGTHKEIDMANYQALINAVLQAAEHGGPRWDKPQGSPCHHVTVSPCTPAAPNQAVPQLPRRQQSALQRRGVVRGQAAWGDVKEKSHFERLKTPSPPLTVPVCKPVWFWRGFSNSSCISFIPCLGQLHAALYLFVCPASWQA